MATAVRCPGCDQDAPDHCASSSCPWVICPTHKEIRLTADQYRALRGRDV